MVELTVALPIYNSKEIAWLALEGLCRQKGIDFEWELLISEEQINEFGEGEIYKYVNRLKEVGCKSVRYFPLDFWTPLPQKWKHMGWAANIDSKVFLLHAADCYSSQNRLKRTLMLANDGHDWIQNRQGYYYSIQDRKIIEFDQRTFKGTCRTGLDMAIRTNLVRNLPVSFIKSGIDNWLYNQVDPQNVGWVENERRSGIDTDGLNNISSKRRRYYSSPEPPFVAADVTIFDLVPEDIAQKLIALKGREAYPETNKRYKPDVK